MADYRRGCGCWTTHTYPCTQAADYDLRAAAKAQVAEFRAQGFVPYDEAEGIWKCRRGCGTLVWFPAEHMRNVCITFSPVAGGENA